MILRMKLMILYQPDSEYAREVETFIHDFQAQHHVDAKIEVYDLNTRDGAATASLYDIVQYPALLTTDDFGTIKQMWQGQDLPLMSEVAGSLL
jgi:hypothetical protein